MTQWVSLNIRRWITGMATRQINSHFLGALLLLRALFFSRVALWRKIAR